MAVHTRNLLPEDVFRVTVQNAIGQYCKVGSLVTTMKRSIIT
jgi:hypothetical protein